MTSNANCWIKNSRNALLIYIEEHHLLSIVLALPPVVITDVRMQISVGAAPSPRQGLA
jgi:hypothetical protein